MTDAFIYVTFKDEGIQIFNSDVASADLISEMTIFFPQNTWSNDL